MREPLCCWINRQRHVRGVDWKTIKAAVERAVPMVLEAATSGSVLGELEEVGIVAVSDKRIAILHEEFLDDPTPTDVITFLHGEIVLSAETAEREARERDLPLEEEIARYAVHGLLHLAGWEDATMEEADAMREVQEKILSSSLGGLC